MVAFALGALWKWYTQWYSPESSALGLLILQRWEEKSSEEAENSQDIQKENPGATRGPVLQTVWLNATHTSSYLKRKSSLWLSENINALLLTGCQECKNEMIKASSLIGEINHKTSSQNKKLCSDIEDRVITKTSCSPDGSSQIRAAKETNLFLHFP